MRGQSHRNDPLLPRTPFVKGLGPIDVLDGDHPLFPAFPGEDGDGSVLRDALQQARGRRRDPPRIAELVERNHPVAVTNFVHLLLVDDEQVPFVVPRADGVLQKEAEGRFADAENVRDFVRSRRRDLSHQQAPGDSDLEIRRGDGEKGVQLDDVLIQIPPITEVKAAKVLKEKRICEDARRGGRLVVQCQSKGLRGEDRRCSRVFAFSHEANSVAWVGERKKDGF